MPPCAIDALQDTVLGRIFDERLDRKGRNFGHQVVVHVPDDVEPVTEALINANCNQQLRHFVWSISESETIELIVLNRKCG